MADRITVPNVGSLPEIVIDVLRNATGGGHGIGDGQAYTTKPEYPHTVVYSLPSSPVTGSAGVGHERIHRATIQLTHVGIDRKQVDQIGDHVKTIMMGQTIRPRAWKYAMGDDQIVVIDRAFQKGEAVIPNGTDVWQRADRYLLVVSPV